MCRQNGWEPLPYCMSTLICQHQCRALQGLMDKRVETAPPALTGLQCAICCNQSCQRMPGSPNVCLSVLSLVCCLVCRTKLYTWCIRNMWLIRQLRRCWEIFPSPAVEFVRCDRSCKKLITCHNFSGASSVLTQAHCQALLTWTGCINVYVTYMHGHFSSYTQGLMNSLKESHQ